MGKHEFQVATTRRAEVITPTVVEDRAPTAGNGQRQGPVLSSKDMGAMGKTAVKDLGAMGKTVVTRAMEIAKIIVSSKAEIGKINAAAAADVNRICAQIEKLEAETKAHVEEAEVNNKIWHSQFDKKAAELKLARDWVTERLKEFGDCSDEVKMKIMDLALCQFR